MGKPNMFLNAWGILFERARELRGRTTDAERILWSRLCKNQLGVKFRRQHPLHSYVVDFYCHSKRLAIELDGPIHDKSQHKFEDSIRTQELTLFGVRILRFKNEEVFRDLDRVVGAIKAVLEK